MAGRSAEQGEDYKMCPGIDAYALTRSPIPSTPSSQPDMSFNSNPPSGDQSPVTPFRRTNQALQQHATLNRATEAPLDITLGIEIECILAHCTFPQLSQTNGLFVYPSSFGEDAVTDALSEPIEAICSTCGEVHLIKLPVKPSPESRHSVSDDTVDTYSRWDVTHDSSISMNEEEKTDLHNNIKYFDFYSIEIRSRILSADTPLQTTPSESDPEHTHSIGYYEEINAVLSHLNKTFNTPPAGRFTLLTNHSCGMHVHVGNGKEGFPLQTVKNMLAAYYACEPAIDTLHASNRIGGSGIPCLPPGQSYVGISTGCFDFPDPDAYNPPMSAVHAKAVHKRRRQAAFPDEDRSFHYQVQYPESLFDSNPAVKDAAFQFTTKAALVLIENAPNVRALQELQAGQAHACTVNLENLQDFQDSDAHGGYDIPKMTIEFRQAASSLDADEVQAWLDVLVSLTHHAHATSDKAFAKLAKATFLSPRFSARNLLTILGCAPRTLAHYGSKVAGSASLALIIARTTQPAHVPAGSVYHDDLAAREEHRLTSSPLFNPFYKLQLPNLKDRLALIHRGHINRRILKKFLAGGYGQFTDHHLNALDFSAIGGDAARQRLRIGWVNPEGPAGLGVNAYASGMGIRVQSQRTPPTPPGTRRGAFFGRQAVDEARAQRQGEEGAGKGKGKGRATFPSEEVGELTQEMSALWSNTADDVQATSHSAQEYPFEHPDDDFHQEYPVNHPDDYFQHHHGLPPPELEAPAPDWFLPSRPNSLSPDRVINFEDSVAYAPHDEPRDHEADEHGSYERAQHIEFADEQPQAPESGIEIDDSDDVDEVLFRPRQTSASTTTTTTTTRAGQ
ncbi:hypothetical protein LTR29_008470 [Friedmanniomyces endolithicus]|nr:hypothetical protein LTR29_008470 [Friedmanniomyces endolithicus]